VVEAQVQDINADTGLAQVNIGHGQLHVDVTALHAGQRVRLQLLARDLILSLHAPQGMSVRNGLAGVISRMTPDERHATLVHVDVRDVELLARVTTPAAVELNLHTGTPLWVLVKVVTLCGHVFHRQS